jgi:hypothetical protein
MVDSIVLLAPLGRSDHFILSFSFLCYWTSPFSSGSRLPAYNRGDYVGMNSTFSSTDWEPILSLPLDEMERAITSKILEATMKFIPTYTPKEGRRHKYPGHIRKLLQQKRNAWGRLQVTNWDEDFAAYDALAKQTRGAIRSFLISSSTALAARISNHPKLLYKIARSKRKTIPSPVVIAAEDGQLSNSPAESANLLAKFYASVFTPSSDLSNTHLSPIPHRSTPILVQQSDVEHLLSNCDPGGSPGPDGLHPRVIKECAHSLSLPLTCLLNASITAGSIPQIWSKAIVCPIYKGGDRHQPSNYRPISLTCIPCKILEKLVKRIVLTQLTSLQFFSPVQHGFLPSRSCLSNLLPFADQVSRASDRGHATHCIFFDISKAFDKIPHDLLATTLADSGVPDSLLFWILSFLENRTFQVRVGDCYSSTANVTSGVPQGSVLGPLLFLIFINGLPNSIPISSAFNADDFKIWSDDPDALQNAINICVEWSSNHGLPVNQDKTTHMAFNCSDPPTFLLNSKDGTPFSIPIKTSAVHKDLGVWTTSSLSPSVMCAESAKKAHKMLNFLKRIFPVITPAMFQPLYSTYVRPHLEYCSIAWLPMLKKDKLILEQVQRRATKSIRPLRSLPYPDRLAALNLFPLEYRRLRGCLIHTFKLFQSGQQEDYFKMSDSGLRGHNRKLFVERANTRLRQSFFAFVTVPVWNKLPSDVVNAPTLWSFKNRLDKVLPSNLPPTI